MLGREQGLGVSFKQQQQGGRGGVLCRQVACESFITWGGISAALGRVQRLGCVQLRCCVASESLHRGGVDFCVMRCHDMIQHGCQHAPSRQSSCECLSCLLLQGRETLPPMPCDLGSLAVVSALYNHGRRVLAVCAFAQRSKQKPFCCVSSAPKALYMNGLVAVTLLTHAVHPACRSSCHCHTPARLASAGMSPVHLAGRLLCVV